ncbi:hypothetical protein BC937DRAFT_94743, partial [Endogone sp. FLAS-F59071]
MHDLTNNSYSRPSCRFTKPSESESAGARLIMKNLIVSSTLAPRVPDHPKQSDRVRVAFHKVRMAEYIPSTLYDPHQLFDELLPSLIPA